jgi:cyclopropane fatty-acyl-phospholipid synthase-like methyltransferase
MLTPVTPVFAQMVDVGCGIGGSSRHISRMFGCTAQGITLSPVQAARANELSKAAGLGDKCRFQVRISPHLAPVQLTYVVRVQGSLIS